MKKFLCSENYRIKAMEFPLATKVAKERKLELSELSGTTVRHIQSYLGVSFWNLSVSNSFLFDAVSSNFVILFYEPLLHVGNFIRGAAICHLARIVALVSHQTIRGRPAGT